MVLRPYLLDLFFPNCCGCCEARILPEELLCPECTKKLTAQRTDYAAWKAIMPEPVPWAGGAAVYPYADTAKAGVLGLKDGTRNFGLHCAALLAGEIHDTLPGVPFDAVAWVPVGARRRRRQGYAHAEFLGRNLARELGLPARDGLLQEHDDGIRQHTLAAAERKQHALRFTHTGQDLTGKTLLLCDDILTTGSTLRRCTEQLLECGAAAVYIAVIAVRLRE